MTTYRIRRAMFSRPEHDLLPSCALHDSFPLMRSREPKKNHKKASIQVGESLSKNKRTRKTETKKVAIQPKGRGGE